MTLFVQQPPPAHLGVVKVSGLGATTTVTTATALSSDSDTSRKRALGSDDNDDGVAAAKRQCVEVVVEKGFDDVIAEIVAVIDEESKMLGEPINLENNNGSRNGTLFTLSVAARTN